MSQIKSKNTKPEIVVRKLLHKMGFRFRLHGKISKKICTKGFLPGKPDIVLKKHMTVIFINGCFWHQHKGCKNATIPKSNTEWWKNKFSDTKQRDIKNVEKLHELGFKVLVIWECETKNENSLINILEENLKY